MQGPFQPQGFQNQAISTEHSSNRYLFYFARHFWTSENVVAMASSSEQDTPFNILGSAKLNTADGKNPPPTSASTTSTSDATAEAVGQIGEKGADVKRTMYQKAHDELEAGLRDEEVGARSKGR